MDDAVHINVKAHFNLRHACGGGRNVDQVEAAEGFVVSGHFPLALQHMNLHRRLIVGCGGENLRALRGDGGVALYELRHHSAFRLNAEREGRDIQQQHILHIAAQHARLDGRADRHYLVGIHAFVRLAACELIHQLRHGRHTGGAAHEQHMVYVAHR